MTHSFERKEADRNALSELLVKLSTCPVEGYESSELVQLYTSTTSSGEARDVLISRTSLNEAVILFLDGYDDFLIDSPMLVRGNVFSDILFLFCWFNFSIIIIIIIIIIF
jgi:hypothetical protein